MKKRLTLLVIEFLLAILILISIINAYELRCLKYGESVPSAQNPRYTCYSNLCQVCVTDNNYPTHPSYCGRDDTCSSGNDTNHTQPPVLIILSPLDNEIYNSKKVLFDLATDEPSSYYYMDNADERGKWSRLSSNAMRYSREKSFRDGLNNLAIKAVDRYGNEIKLQRKFYVDTKKPKLGKIEIDNRGEFKIDFTEENPTSLFLKFGNSRTGYNSYLFNLNDNCVKETGGKYSCEVQVTYNEYIAIISPYSDQEIDYWFELSDIINNTEKSKTLNFLVDIASPVINNPDSMFTVAENHVNFNINITEPNFEEVSYYDNSKSNPKWKKLCTSLKNGICRKKATFSKGEHVVDVRVLDKSGNSVLKRINFSIN